LSIANAREIFSPSLYALACATDQLLVEIAFAPAAATVFALASQVFEEHQWIPPRMQIPKLLSLAILTVHCFVSVPRPPALVFRRGGIGMGR
jgi:hypothetical protein